MNASTSLLPPWRPLLKAAQHKEGRSPMSRWLQLATVTAEGCPRVRTLVFRGWRDGFTLELLTDRRSAKSEELSQDPRVEVCWLLPKARCQFRFRGQALRLTPELQQRLEQKHWERLHPEGRALWGWPPPGQALSLDSDFPLTIPDGAPTPSCFQLISLEIDRVDLLELTDTPHRRRCWSAENGWQEIALNP
ncbi:MAG: pyridoxamine 5'-phosphate oxidase family protein [Synechococcus sp.]|nr:pyridoxamine 5'-phosphate oxidase family protein [Synechococcus sp.]